MFWILSAATIAAIYGMVRYAGASGAPTSPVGPAELGALNSQAWIPISTNKTPKNPDGSGIAAHWTLPIGAEVHFDVQHGARPADDSSHVAEVVGIVNAPHASGSSDPYEIFVVAVASTQGTVAGEKLPETGDVLAPTPGKIISYKLPASTGGVKI